jgi:actin-related protein
MEETNVVIVEFGFGQMLAGFAEDDPEWVKDYPVELMRTTWADKDKRCFLDLLSEMFSALNAKPSEVFLVLCGDVPQLTKSKLRFVVTLVFDDLEVGGFCFLNNNVLLLVTQHIGSGVVISLGVDSLAIVPVVEGRIVAECVSRLGVLDSPQEVGALLKDVVARVDLLSTGNVLERVVLAGNNVAAEFKQEVESVVSDFNRSLWPVCLEEDPARAAWRAAKQWVDSSTFNQMVVLPLNFNEEGPDCVYRWNDLV